MTPFGKPVVPEVYCMLHTSSGRTPAAMRRICSRGTKLARSIASSKVRQPGIRKPTVMTLRRNGSLRQCRAEPGFAAASSGQRVWMISR